MTTDPVDEQSRSNDEHVLMKRVFRSLVRDHPYVYWTLLGGLALSPSYFFIRGFGGGNGLVIAGLNALVVAYVGDFIQLFIRESHPRDREPASALHVFVVAWFLPFLLTLSPAVQHILDPHYFDLIIWRLDPDLMASCEFIGTKSDEYNALIQRAMIPVFLHSAIFSSLVVLVPLEFFALLFLEGEERRAQRHGLIAAGCLDVATLAFLSLVATDFEVVSFVPGEGRSMLIGFMIALWIVSLLSSFQAIYVAQYQEFDDGDQAKAESRT